MYVGISYLSYTPSYLEWILATAEDRGPFLNSPLGENFDPQGRSCPPGVNFVP
jgi:hypothetical protein